MLNNKEKTELIAKYRSQLNLVEATINTYDFSECEIGEKYYLNENIFFFRAVVTTKNTPDFRLEAHNKMIDVQYAYRGDEQFIIGLRDKLQLVTDYDEDKDIMWFKPIDDQDLTYYTNPQGSMVILFPEECHEPENKGSSNQIDKIVFKIKVTD